MFSHERAPCGVNSLRSDTLTMRVTGVKLTVFCSAIVIMSLFTVIPQGPFLSQTAENNCPYHRVVGFLILSSQFGITVALAQVLRSLKLCRAIPLCGSSPSCSRCCCHVGCVSPSPLLGNFPSVAVYSTPMPSPRILRQRWISWEERFCPRERGSTVVSRGRRAHHDERSGS